MHRILTRKGAIALFTTILFLLLIKPPGVSAQEGLNSRICAECSPAVPFSADTTVNLGGWINGCFVRITYSKRICGQNYDINIKKIQIDSGQQCNSYSTAEMATVAIASLLYDNPMHFPPYNSPANQKFNWRIVRPACWSYNPIAKSMDPCPSSPCCMTLLAAYYNGCEALTFINGFQRSLRASCGTPPEGGSDCEQTCSEDLIGDYSRITNNKILNN